MILQVLDGSLLRVAEVFLPLYAIDGRESMEGPNPIDLECCRSHARHHSIKQRNINTRTAFPCRAKDSLAGQAVVAAGALRA